MINGTITLIRRKFKKDGYGVDQEVTEKNLDIFVQANYPTRQEFYEATRSGLRPAFTFIIHPLDYNQENELEYEGKTYRIYRTYQRDGDHLELYTEERIGNGG